MIRNECRFSPSGEERQPISELQKARDEMKAAQRRGGFAYKQAKAHYERVLRKERTGKVNDV